LSALGDIDGMLERAVSAGGSILREKGFMGEGIGWIAYIQDSEGNRVGIQQPG
jgi:predicted enzyme related to lactoylglutathione lyase